MRASRAPHRYESQKEYKLKRVETPVQARLRVERMKLSKDKTALAYNGYLTLEGIPPEVFEYRLEPLALEWVMTSTVSSATGRPGEGRQRSQPPDDEEYPPFGRPSCRRQRRDRKAGEVAAHLVDCHRRNTAQP